MPTYRCRLNGRVAALTSWDPSQPLLYSLRGAPGLTGTKIGCAMGQCGSCTVILDGEAVRSCLVPTSAIAGRSITTIEGIGTPEKPDRVQAAFIAEQATQCGYCTTGMVMAARALLMRTPNPTVEQIKEGLAGNLCRCGAHTRIIKAVQRAAGR